MVVKKIKLRDFRNVKTAEISLKEGMNFFLGENAQGKTNALEAIYLFSRGKSFRGARDGEMVREGEEGFFTEITFLKEDREETLSYAFFGKEKERKRNGILLNSLSEMIGSFNAVLFSPDHLQMVKGSPSERRQFLNVAILGCYPVYLSIYNEYARALEQRNALLKDMQRKGASDTSLLSVWNEKLSSLAAKIYLYRKEYVEKLNLIAGKIMAELSGGKEEMRLIYQSDISSFESVEDEKGAREAYERVFSVMTDKEIAFGSSLYGVQRDELLILINGKSARDYGSQGQQRSAVLSLKMAEGEISKEIRGESPVYLFDDVLSELDEGRRKFLLSGMKGRQFIVTGCERGILGEKDESVHVIRVKNGEFFFEG